MPIFTLYDMTLDELLNNPNPREDVVVYDKIVGTLYKDKPPADVHHIITEADACWILRKIISDPELIAGMKAELEAPLDPNGNQPVDGAHPVDPNVVLVKSIIDERCPSKPSAMVWHAFTGPAYQFVTNQQNAGAQHGE
jgi:hypothetical protein